MIYREAFAGLFSYCTHMRWGCRCAFFYLKEKILLTHLRPFLNLMNDRFCRNLESICWIVFILHKHTPQGVLFLLGVVTFYLFLTFDFDTINFIDFNSWQMISSKRYLRESLLDCFHIAHIHLLGGLDVSFWGL